MYTGQGRGWREGVSGPSVGWGLGGGGRVTRQGRGKGLGGACVCGRARLGIFFDISRRYCIVFTFFNPLLFTSKSSCFTFSFFWVMKNNKE